MERPVLIFIFIFLLLIANTEAYLGTFQQNQCVPIVTILNSSSATIGSISSPSPNSTVLATNLAMTKIGNAFNYTFCNTSYLGTYTYGYCDAAGNCYSNDFKVNTSGQDVTSEQVFLIIIGLVVMLIMAAFFFILSLLFKHPGTKIFLMALSALTMIVLIAITASQGEVYLAQFGSLITIYNNYYIFIISLAGAAMAGIIVWLIYYSLKLFNKSRGRIPEDD